MGDEGIDGRKTLKLILKK